MYPNNVGPLSATAGLSLQIHVNIQCNVLKYDSQVAPTDVRNTNITMY